MAFIAGFIIGGLIVMMVMSAFQLGKSRRDPQNFSVEKNEKPKTEEPTDPNAEWNLWSGW